MRITIHTIGDCIEQGYTIWLSCNARRGDAPCNHNRALDLDRLARHLGRDHSILADQLVPHLFCPKCRSKEVSIGIHPPTGFGRG